MTGYNLVKCIVEKEKNKSAHILFIFLLKFGSVCVLYFAGGVYLFFWTCCSYVYCVEKYIFFRTRCFVFRCSLFKNKNNCAEKVKQGYNIHIYFDIYGLCMCILLWKIECGIYTWYEFCRCKLAISFSCFYRPMT